MYADTLANSAELTGQTDVALMAMSGILFTSGVVSKRVLAVVGIFADGFILAFDISESASDFADFADAEMIVQFYEQKKQKDELDKATRELYVSRIIARMYGSMCDAIKTQDGIMLSYLILVGDDGTIDPDDQRAADKIAGKLVDYVKQDWSPINTNSSLDLLVVLDEQRGSWTTDDPSYQDALDGAEDKLKADPPETPYFTHFILCIRIHFSFQYG